VPLRVFAIPVWQRDDGHGHRLLLLDQHLLRHLSGLLRDLMLSGLLCCLCSGLLLLNLLLSGLLCCLCSGLLLLNLRLLQRLMLSCGFLLIPNSLLSHIEVLSGKKVRLTDELMSNSLGCCGCG
jgi:hypothetical protein